MFQGTQSSQKCFLNPGRALGRAAPGWQSSLLPGPGYLGIPLAEASWGQQAGGLLETLEGCGSPGCSQPPREQAPLTRDAARLVPCSFLPVPSLTRVLLEGGSGGECFPVI